MMGFACPNCSNLFLPMPTWGTRTLLANVRVKAQSAGDSRSTRTRLPDKPWRGAIAISASGDSIIRICR
jgi:hypothetical protein